MDREELRTKFSEVLTVDDQATRSTMLNDMRSTIEKTFKELDDLKSENEELKNKNASLTEANSKLFMQIGVDKAKDGKPSLDIPMDLRKLGI